MILLKGLLERNSVEHGWLCIIGRLAVKTTSTQIVSISGIQSGGSDNSWGVTTSFQACVCMCEKLGPAILDSGTGRLYVTSRHGITSGGSETDFHSLKGVLG